MIRQWWRSLSRDSRSHLVVAALCFAFALYSQYQTSRAYQRLDSNQSSQQAVGYGIWYALVEEQKKAGRFEGARDAARSELSALRYRLGVSDARLASCNATTNMTTDDGWTGQLQLKTERER